MHGLLPFSTEYSQPVQGNLSGRDVVFFGCFFRKKMEEENMEEQGEEEEEEVMRRCGLVHTCDKPFVAKGENICLY